jgi:predicted ester cyclase
MEFLLAVKRFPSSLFPGKLSQKKLSFLENVLMEIVNSVLAETRSSEDMLRYYSV